MLKLASRSFQCKEAKKLKYRFLSNTVDPFIQLVTDNLMVIGIVLGFYLLVLLGFVTQNVAAETSVFRRLLEERTNTPKLYCIVFPVSTPSSMKYP